MNLPTYRKDVISTSLDILCSAYTSPIIHSHVTSSLMLPCLSFILMIILLVPWLILHVTCYIPLFSWSIFHSHDWSSSFFPHGLTPLPQVLWLTDYSSTSVTITQPVLYLVTLGRYLHLYKTSRYCCIPYALPIVSFPFLYSHLALKSLSLVCNLSLTD